MTVLRDDGLYRHLRFRAADTWAYGFDIVTWPGYLYIGGDIEDFVFARTPDMFEFFERGARDSRGINPHYWAEKLQGAQERRSGGRRYTPESFRSRVLAWAREALREWDEEAAEAQADGWLEDHPAVYPSLLLGALERELLYIDLFHSLPADQGDAHELLADHAWLFGEGTWEWDLTEYDPWFLWACWAIVWGIEQYRALPDAAEPDAGERWKHPTLDGPRQRQRRRQRSGASGGSAVKRTIYVCPGEGCSFLSMTPGQCRSHPYPCRAMGPELVPLDVIPVEGATRELPMPGKQAPTQIRVLVGDSVWEDAHLSVRDEVVYLEFDAEDLDSISLPLSAMSPAMRSQEPPADDESPTTLRHERNFWAWKYSRREEECEELADRLRKIEATPAVRLRAIASALFYGISPWQFYESKKHYAPWGYWTHLRVNLRVAGRWLMFRETTEDRKFEREVNSR